MALVLTRIDDRLIHGQVVEGWVRALAIERILVANDELASDPLERELVELAVPSQIELIILSIQEAAKELDGHLSGKRVLLLVSSPSDLVKIIEEGAGIKEVNVGGLHYLPGREQIFRSIWVGPEEKKAFRTLQEKGFQLQIQILPTDHPINLMEKLEQQQ